MSFLSAIGQINAVVQQFPVAVGGAGSTVVDVLTTTASLPNGVYLASFSTQLGGGGVTAGSLEFSFGATVLAETSFVTTGAYLTLSAPIIVTTGQLLSVSAVGVGAPWTSTAGTLVLVRLP